MTINKSQGQTLEHVGVYIKTPVFMYGQLYVALSRATSFENLHVMIHPILHGDRNVEWTKNIVYQELFEAVGISI